MAKLKDYEAFPNGLGAVKKSAKRSRTGTSGLLKGPLPILAGAAAVLFFMNRAKKNQANANTSANTAAPVV